MLERTPARYLDKAERKRNVSSRSMLTTRFRTAWKLGVEGIVAAAQVIVEATKPILAADLARLHWLCSSLSIEEAIESLRADPGGNTPQSLRELGRKLVAIAKEWQQRR